MNNRLEIFRLLSSTNPNVFDTLLELTGIPAGIVPPNQAAPGQRVSAFLQWWEGPTSFGKPIESLFPLVKVATVIDLLYRLPSPQFEQIVFTFGLSSSVPGSSAPQRDRVRALMSQVNLEELVSVVESICGVRV